MVFYVSGGGLGIPTSNQAKTPGASAKEGPHECGGSSRAPKRPKWYQGAPPLGGGTLYSNIMRLHPRGVDPLGEAPGGSRL